MEDHKSLFVEIQSKLDKIFDLLGIKHPDPIVGEEICVDDAGSVAREKGFELASCNHSDLKSETTDEKHSDEEIEVNELPDCAVMLDFNGIHSNDSTNSEVVLDLKGYKVSESTINSHSSVNSSHQERLTPMDSGLNVLSIYCAHMATKWSHVLDSQPIQGNDMSVEVYYDQFYNWKKKLDAVDYIGGEESYIDDFFYGLKRKLAVRVWDYKWKPHTLSDAFRRAEIEENMMKNDADKVFVKMIEPVLEEDLLGIEVTKATRYMLDETPTRSPVNSDENLYDKNDYLSSFPCIIETSSGDNGSNCVSGLLTNTSKIFDPGTLALFKQEDYECQLNSHESQLHCINSVLFQVVSSHQKDDNRVVVMRNDAKHMFDETTPAFRTNVIDGLGPYTRGINFNNITLFDPGGIRKYTMSSGGGVVPELFGIAHRTCENGVEAIDGKKNIMKSDNLVVQLEADLGNIVSLNADRDVLDELPKLALTASTSYKLIGDDLYLYSELNSQKEAIYKHNFGDSENRALKMLNNSTELNFTVNVLVQLIVWCLDELAMPVVTHLQSTMELQSFPAFHNYDHNKECKVFAEIPKPFSRDAIDKRKEIRMRMAASSANSASSSWKMIFGETGVFLFDPDICSWHLTGRVLMNTSSGVIDLKWIAKVFSSFDTDGCHWPQKSCSSIVCGPVVHPLYGKVHGAGVNGMTRVISSLRHVRTAVAYGDWYYLIVLHHFCILENDNHALISLISASIAHGASFSKSLFVEANSKSLRKLLCSYILHLGRLTNVLDLVTSFGSWIGLLSPQRAEFAWDPGICAISVHILEDKDLFERVGKDMVFMDTTLVIRGYDHEVQMSLNTMKDFGTYILHIGLDTSRLGKFELGLLANDLKYYGCDDVIIAILENLVWDPGQNNTLLYILEDMLRSKRFKLLFLGDPDSDNLDVSCGLPNGFGNLAAASLVSSILELEHFIWDPGLFISVLQAFWKESGVNFYFTTLRTRWFSRGMMSRYCPF